jgi:hypothetical protein
MYTIPTANSESVRSKTELVTRRRFLVTGTGCLTAAASGALVHAAQTSEPNARPKSPAKRSGMAVPMAQEYTVVATVADSARSFFVNPGFALLPTGSLVAVAARDPRQRPPAGTIGPGSEVVVSRSGDRGQTWQEVACLPMKELVGTALFVHERRLYLLIAPKHIPKGIIRVAASDDEGRTWTAPADVSTGPHGWYGGHQQGMVIRNGKLYVAVSEMFKRMAILSCDLKQGIMRPESWTVSNVAEMPIPKELNAELFPGEGLRCLEGNVVLVNGRLRVLARAVIDRNGTANMAAIFDAIEEDGRLSLNFSQLYPMPGGQCKFMTVFDPESQLFWMASNPVANSQYWVNPELSTKSRLPGNDRRFLMLWYASDGMNWFPAGCIAAAQSLKQSFHYPCIDIDGADLAVLSRTSVNSGDYHDSELLTFHRVRDFRSLAMDIWPRV